jgi:hypothetical protein
MLVLQTNRAKKSLLFEGLAVTLTLFLIELLDFFEKPKFWTRVDKEKFMIFSKLIL